MKAIGIVGLALAMLGSSRLSGAQVLTDDVGVPLGGSWNPGTPIIIFKEVGTEGQVTTVGSPGFSFTTVSPGDLILTNENNPGGGDAPSNWLADIRFFNPLDPTGILGLPATETEAFFPDDVGPGGFASFHLLPDFNYVPAAAITIPGNPVIGTEELFDPVEGILPGQQAIIALQATPGAQAAATPEPGGLALLFGVGAVGVGLLVRRLCCYHQPANGQLMGS